MSGATTTRDAGRSPFFVGATGGTGASRYGPAPARALRRRPDRHQRAPDRRRHRRWRVTSPRPPSARCEAARLSTRTPISRSCRSTPTATTCSRSSSATRTSVHVGDPTVAVGSADCAVARTLTTGHVSATRRRNHRGQRLRLSTTSSRPTRSSTPATRAARCSTSQGEVIGVNSEMGDPARQRRRSVKGFAVPDRHRQGRPPVVLQETGHVERAYLGLVAGSARRWGRVTVDRVQANSPAARAGVRSSPRCWSRSVGPRCARWRTSPTSSRGRPRARCWGWRSPTALSGRTLQATLALRPANVPAE